MLPKNYEPKEIEKKAEENSGGEADTKPLFIDYDIYFNFDG